ncbi:MAG: hypothetical protein Q7S15_02685 [bacterium]|nr:hypothetical protein [bacterium]
MVALTEANFPEVARSLNFLYTTQGTFTMAAFPTVLRNGRIANEVFLFRDGRPVSSIELPPGASHVGRSHVKALLAEDITTFDRDMEVWYDHFGD